MKSIEIRTRLTCSPAALWRVLLDFDRYPEWNPLFSLEPLGAARDPRRALVAGDFLRLSLGDPEASARRISLPVRVVEHLPERALVWRGGVPGLIVGTHHLRRVECDGASFLDHGEAFNGLFTPLFPARKLEALRREYARVSERLVERAGGTPSLHGPLRCL